MFRPSATLHLIGIVKVLQEADVAGNHFLGEIKMHQPLLISVLLLSLTACSEQPDSQLQASSDLAAATASTPSVDGAEPPLDVVVQADLEPQAEVISLNTDQRVSEQAEESVADDAPNLKLASIESHQVLQQVVEQKVERATPALKSIELEAAPVVQLVSVEAIPVIGPAMESTIDQDVTTQRILNQQERKILAELPDTDRFVKMNNKGQPQLAEVESWNCVMDRSSGLIWETKANGSQRHAQHTYGVLEGRGECGAASCTIEQYVKQVNQMALCGRSDWRVPNKAELMRLVDYAYLDSIPSIDIRYFSNTQKGRYWSTDDFEHSDKHLWSVSFSDGFNYIHRKDNAAHLRLVSGN